MATMLGSLLVSLGLESGEFKSGLDAAEKQMKASAKRIERIGRDMANTGRNLSIAVTVPLAALGVASFKAASDAAELESAFKQTFGAMSKDMENWAQTTGDAMGRSTQELQNAANTFGIFFNQAAPTKQAAADLSKQFTILAQDLSSFYNTSPDEALQKLRSGLSGESEPLRDFGVFLNEATVAQKAMQMGLAATSKELTDQDKILARANLIMEATVNAQGDVARTSEGTANKVRAAKAAFEELQVVIGQKLIPAITPLINGLANLLNQFNKLPSGVQTAVVMVGGFAAALGPVLYLVGNLTRVMGPAIAAFKTYGPMVMAAAKASGSAIPILAGLRAAIISLTASLAPYLVALAAVAGAYYLITFRSKETKEATERYAQAQKDAEVATEAAAAAGRELASAHGEARIAALELARAEAENIKKKRDSAWWSLQLAKAELQRARVSTRTQRNATTGGVAGTAGFIQGFGDRKVAGANENVAVAEATLDALEKGLKKIQSDLAAPAPVAPSSSVSVPKTGGAGRTRKGRDSGRSAADIEAMFADAQMRLEMEALSAKERLALNLEDRVDLQYEMLELERQQRLAEIDANEDFSTKQKDALKKQIEALYGTAVQIDETGKIIATGNKGLIAQQIEQDRAFELERRAMEMDRVRFDNQRELLDLDYEMADTQGERALIAADILRLEQEYRRNQLEMVIASKTSSDAEKARAQAILDSLAAIEAGERASSARRNETDAQRYSRELNKTGAQMSEEIDRIKINGLESLNDALTDAIVNFKSLKDVVSNVVKSVLADLIRLQIQQAIIRPLANAMGLGFPGFATGTSFAPGGLAIVGERGPELVDLPRGSRVYTNGVSKTMLGGQQGGGWQGNMIVNTPDADSFRRSERQVSRNLNRRLER